MRNLSSVRSSSFNFDQDHVLQPRIAFEISKSHQDLKEATGKTTPNQTGWQICIFLNIIFGGNIVSNLRRVKGKPAKTSKRTEDINRCGDQTTEASFISHITATSLLLFGISEEEAIQRMSFRRRRKNDLQSSDFPQQKTSSQ